METTKVSVEYLIIGLLVGLAAFFLFANIAPDETRGLWSTLMQYSSIVNAGIAIMVLPVFYGVGIVTEYLGMFLFDRYLEKIKEERFGKYVSQNLDWLGKSRLLSRFAKKGLAVPEGSGQQMYGQMRFFVLMNNAYLYDEIKAQINRYRILRVLIIVEILFLAGFAIHFIARGIDSLSLSITITVVFLLAITTRALRDRYNRYCRAIEHSFKALALDEFGPNAKAKQP